MCISTIARSDYIPAIRAIVSTGISNQGLLRFVKIKIRSACNRARMPRINTRARAREHTKRKKNRINFITRKSRAVWTVIRGNSSSSGGIVVIVTVVVSLINSSIHHSINNLFAISARVGRRPSAREFETWRLSGWINQFLLYNPPRRAPVTCATSALRREKETEGKGLEATMTRLDISQ